MAEGATGVYPVFVERVCTREMDDLRRNDYILRMNGLGQCLIKRNQLITVDHEHTVQWAFPVRLHAGVSGDDPVIPPLANRTYLSTNAFVGNAVHPPILHGWLNELFYF